MADIVDRATRSRMMSSISAKNTKPEIRVRKLLFALGFRFRIHARLLPGTPDVVLPRHKVALFVHGCFWHQHDCPAFRLPKTNQSFWEEKLDRNKENDRDARRRLAALGWRVGVIWECALRGKGALLPIELSRRLNSFILSSSRNCSIASKRPATCR